MTAMLAAIFRKKFAGMLEKSSAYCREKNCVKIQKNIFISDVFVHGSHIVGHFEKQVDKETILHHKNSVIIRCRLGEVGGHTHTQDSDQNLFSIWLCGNNG